MGCCWPSRRGDARDPSPRRLKRRHPPTSSPTERQRGKLVKMPLVKNRQQSSGGHHFHFFPSHHREHSGSSSHPPSSRTSPNPDVNAAKSPTHDTSAGSTSRQSPNPDVASARSLFPPASGSHASPRKSVDYGDRDKTPGSSPRPRSTSLGDATPRPSAISLLPNFVRPAHSHHSSTANLESGPSSATPTAAASLAAAVIDRRPSLSSFPRPDFLKRADKDDRPPSPLKPSGASGVLSNLGATLASRAHSLSDAGSSHRPHLRPLNVITGGGGSSGGGGGRSGLSPASASAVAEDGESLMSTAGGRAFGGRSDSVSGASYAPSVRELTAGLKPGDVWSQILRRVLPIFNGDPPIGYIEDLNALVSQHLRRHVSESPSRALLRVSGELSDLLATGASTVYARLNSSSLEDGPLLDALAGAWATYFGTSLVWLDAVFLPLETEGGWLAVERKGKGRAETLSGYARSPSVPAGGGGFPTFPSGPSVNGHAAIDDSPAVDVRRFGLIAFRDQVVAPLLPRLLRYYAPDSPDHHPLPAGAEGEGEARKMQMVAVLASVQTGEDRQAGVDELASRMRAAMGFGAENGARRGSAGGVRDPERRRGWVGRKRTVARRVARYGRAAAAAAAAGEDAGWAEAGSYTPVGTVNADGGGTAGASWTRSPLSPGEGTADDGEWTGDWGLVGEDD